VSRLLLLFVALPILDLWLLLRIGDAAGFWGVLALILVPSLVGAWLARREGRRVLRAWQSAVREGRTPEEGLVSAALILAGGVLLIVPGVVTDVLGVALLVPSVRRRAVGGVRRWIRRRIDDGRIRVVGHVGGPEPDEPIDVTPRR
jgi:UPF0716 protein FxsA